MALTVASRHSSETSLTRMWARSFRFWRDKASAGAMTGLWRPRVGQRGVLVTSLARAVQPPGIGPADQGVGMIPHLSAVLAADIAGYSRMMELDPRDCISRLRAIRHDVIEPASKLYGATLVRYAGDSVLAEFPSVSNAVIFAIEVQRRIPELEKYVPEERQIWLRMGICSGQVFTVDGDLHGTSVNIASRLQVLAAPGEIYLSEAALNQARNELSFRCQSLGTRQLKNIVSPVQVFRIPLEELLRPNTDIQVSR
jgi:class 3 adenylate cyclase